MKEFPFIFTEIQGGGMEELNISLEYQGPAKICIVFWKKTGAESSSSIHVERNGATSCFLEGECPEHSHQAAQTQLLPQSCHHNLIIVCEVCDNWRYARASK